MIWISVYLAIAATIKSAPVPGGGVSHGVVMSGTPLETTAYQNMNAFTHNAFVPNYHYQPPTSPSSSSELKKSASSESLKSSREKSWLKEATHQSLPHEVSRPLTRKHSLRTLRHFSSPPHLEKRMLSKAFKKQKIIETPEGPIAKPISVPDNYRHMTSPIDENVPMDTTHLPDLAEHEYSSSFGSHSYGSQKNHRQFLSSSMSAESTASTSSMKRVSKFHDLHALGESLKFQAPKNEFHVPRISFHK
jgi:hypothetical protein